MEEASRVSTTHGRQPSSVDHHILSSAYRSRETVTSAHHTQAQVTARYIGRIRINSIPGAIAVCQQVLRLTRRNARKQASLVAPSISRLSRSRMVARWV